MNGQELAEQNYRAWRTWVEAKDDRDFRALAAGGKLKRAEIVRECGFSRSVLVQNPRIKQELAEVESGLRDRGILAGPTAPSSLDPEGEAEPLRQRGQMSAAVVGSQLKDLEQRVQTLREENNELRRQLRRYEGWERHLVGTGRLPR